MNRIRVGTSGYMYRHWRGTLYPRGLPQRRWLEHYSRFFDTVEMNATFYSLPSAASVDRWRELVPAGFKFAVKGSRYLTHLRRLIDPAEGLRKLFAPVSRFGEKLGPVLWQLPPNFRPDHERLDRFLASLPPLEHAVEFRNPDWYTETTCAVLEKHGAAFCEHDNVDRAPPHLTGRFRYVRFHGTSGRYAGRYGPAALRRFAESYLQSAAHGIRVFVYFNNDALGNAVKDALDLLALVGEERPSLQAT